MIIARSGGVPSVTTASFPSYEEAEVAFLAVEKYNTELIRLNVRMGVRVVRLYRKA